ncbi:septum site-determining protein MinC [Limnobacter parvus]|uniref:Probable septum site-determining protein MinC n=1 Tax=Limnobacter parvus TaxID=2939690 RepID=A0ABT1XGN5_9BURK|nr:septum site-determining protein MinC [Limnobacter parvus]MCR2746456.1 septum site-determining protein MinC [Limnobacter parvus]
MNRPTTAPLDIKFAKIKAVTFALRPCPLQESLGALKKRLGPSPGVYSAEPAVLDFSAWEETELVEHSISLSAYLDVLKAAGVHLVEIRAHSAGLESQAEELGLRFETGGDETESTTESKTVPVADTIIEPIIEQGTAPLFETESTPDVAQHPAVPEFDNVRRSMVIEQSVRSGQKIYAQGADLIVMGQVSAGAEVIADGNVHVYGVLRGRALAGAAGDTQARILSTCFEAELVAVAGYYLTFEGGFPEENRSKPTLIHLDHGTEPAVLRLKAINIR